MALADEDIETILRAQLGEDAADVLALAGVEPTGDLVADFKYLAHLMGLEVEDLLYALFVEDEPLFDDKTWTDLTGEASE